jgi:hypothetical protein
LEIFNTCPNIKSSTVNIERKVRGNIVFEELGEVYLTLASIQLAQQQPAAALQCAVDARAIFEPLEYYRRGEAILLEARSVATLQDYALAHARLIEACAEFDRLQQPHHRAAAKLVQAQLLLAETGDNEQALNLLNEAKATFVELGLKRLEKEAERLMSGMNSTRG